MAKTSVEAEWKAARSVRKQGERSEMKHLLLYAVPKVAGCKKCSEHVRGNAWNEVTGGTGTLFENIGSPHRKRVSICPKGVQINYNFSLIMRWSCCSITFTYILIFYIL